jgi:hypothetical protein
LRLLYALRNATEQISSVQLCIFHLHDRTAHIFFPALLLLPLMTRGTVDDKRIEPMNDFAYEEKVLIYLFLSQRHVASKEHGVPA